MVKLTLPEPITNTDIGFFFIDIAGGNNQTCFIAFNYFLGIGAHFGGDAFGRDVEGMVVGFRLRIGGVGGIAGGERKECEEEEVLHGVKIR